MREKVPFGRRERLGARLRASARSDEARARSDEPRDSLVRPADEDAQRWELAGMSRAPQHGRYQPTPAECAETVLGILNQRHLFDARWFDMGVYENGREHGFRITRRGPAKTAGAVWFSENRNSDHIVLYHSTAPLDVANPFDLEGDGRTGDDIYQRKEMFLPGREDDVADRIAELLGAPIRPYGV